MTLKAKFELLRWLHYVVLFFLGVAAGMLIVQIVAVPFLLWLFDDTPYAFPGWHSLGRWTLWALFVGFFAGTLSWYTEKRSGGR